MKYFIITSSGGGGLLTSAKGIRDEILSREGEPSVDIVDVMGLDRSVTSKEFHGKSWIPSFGIPFTKINFFSGYTNVSRWNNAQKKGGIASVNYLNWLVNNQIIAEQLSASTIASNLTDVIKNNPDLIEIIDVQSINTAEICQVVTQENKRRARLNPPGQPIHIRKVLFEFLTDRLSYFHCSINRVNPDDSHYLRIHIVNTPLLGPEDKNSDDFFKRHRLNHLKFESINPQVRKAFHESHDALQITSLSEEQSFLEKKFSSFPASAIQKKDATHYTIQKSPEDKFITISLGSQGSSAILSYIDSFIDQVTATKSLANNKLMLFLVAGKNDGSNDTLYAAVRMHLELRQKELVRRGVQWPSQAIIVPLSGQDEVSMASLFQNSDILITRTGGTSCFEALQTKDSNPNRQLLVHSEASPDTPMAFPRQHFDACYDTLLPGTMQWEGGNAQYLMKNLDASLTCPEIVNFNLENNTPRPHFSDSLLKIAHDQKLAVTQLAQITDCLQHGSNPNMDSFADLPVIAYAQDIPTLECLIAYGGKLTPPTLAHLKKQFTPHDIKQLLQYERKIKKEIKQHGAPRFLNELVFNAVQTDNKKVLLGLLHRFPKLAALSGLDTLAHRRGANDLYRIIALCRGETTLQFALQQTYPSMPEQRTIKALILDNLHELNERYDSGEKPLNLCKNKHLREYMVKLGANPDCVDTTVSETERKHLHKLYQQNIARVRNIKRALKEAFHAYSNHENRFCESVSQSLKDEFSNLSDDEADLLSKVTYKILQATDNDIHSLSLWNTIINFIKKYIFGTDLMTKTITLESNKILFFNQRVKHTAIEPTVDLSLPTNSANNTPSGQ